MESKCTLCSHWKYDNSTDTFICDVDYHKVDFINFNELQRDCPLEGELRCKKNSN